jgi:membrane fusion protein, copper/silver efflux system
MAHDPEEGVEAPTPPDSSPLVAQASPDKDKPLDESPGPELSEHASPEKDKPLDESPRPELSEHAPPPRHAAPSPRSLRILSLVRWGLLAVVAFVAVASVVVFWGPSSSGVGATKLASDGNYYCPMHPQIRGEKGGECPICHMNLEPIPADRLGSHGDSAHGHDHGTASAPAPALAPGGVVPVTVTEAAQRTVGLATTLVTEASLGEHLRVPGVIQAPESGVAEVRVRAAGFVEQVAVSQTGVHVHRGQPLAYVYSPEIYRAQEELIAASKWSDSGLPGLFGAGGEGGAGAAEPSGKNESLVAASRRALELLGLSKGDLDEVLRTGRPQRAVAVRAPRSGYITQFHAVLGSRATPETLLYEIADLSTVWIVASIHERDLPAITVGTEARFVVAGTKESAWTGKLSLIEPFVDPATRTTRARLVVPNRAPGDGKSGASKKTSGIGPLRPGQYGEVELDLPTTNGLFVPQEAVIRTGEHAYVFVATGADRFEPHEVELGLAKDARVQITEGVRAGDRVVSRGGFLLDAESRLQASLLAQPTAAPSASGK